MRIPREAFEKLVAQALDDLPQEFAEKLEGVEVVVEDRPTAEDLRRTNVPATHLVLGLYRGIPLNAQSVFRGYEMPHQIVLFQEPIERIADTPVETVREVRRTVLHEIAHHFGISDKRLRDLGY